MDGLTTILSAVFVGIILYALIGLMAYAFWLWVGDGIRVWFGGRGDDARKAAYDRKTYGECLIYALVLMALSLVVGLVFGGISLGVQSAGATLFLSLVAAVINTFVAYAIFFSAPPTDRLGVKLVRFVGAFVLMLFASLMTGLTVIGALLLILAIAVTTGSVFGATIALIIMIGLLIFFIIVAIVKGRGAAKAVKDDLGGKVGYG